jgi:hypothetical protein
MSIKLKLKGDHLENLGVGRIMNLRETGLEDVQWIHLSQDIRTWTSGRLF